MVSKNTIILFFFLALSCSGIVEALKCHKRKLDLVTKKTILDENEVACTRGEEYCEVMAQIMRNPDGKPEKLHNYLEQCELSARIKEAATRLNMTEQEFDNLKWIKVNGNDNQKCTIMNNKYQARIYCVCSSDSCNKVGSELHNLFLQEFKRTLGLDFDKALSGETAPADPPTAPEDARTETIDSQDPKDDDSGSAEIKPIMTIMSFAIIVYNIILV